MSGVSHCLSLGGVRAGLIVRIVVLGVEQKKLPSLPSDAVQAGERPSALTTSVDK